MATDEILNYVRDRIVDSISKDGQKDGFDGILLRINKKSGELNYSAAANTPLLINGNLMIELQADKMPVGENEKNSSFTMHSLDLNKGDMLYLYTDGYADQFGGPKGKKFKYKALNDLLLSISSKPLDEQHNMLENAFTSWKGNLEQVDDVCVVGIRI